MTTALILGVGGQDGSYLAECLLQKGYEVYGLHRKSSADNLFRVKHLYGLRNFTLIEGDILDASNFDRVFTTTRPDELYNLADQDNVRSSQRTPSYSCQVTFAAVNNILETVRLHHPDCNVFQPVSATMFEGSDAPQDESSAIFPRSPYAVCKTATYHLCRMYRVMHSMNVTTGIMFNHDSPRRGPDYLLQVIARQAFEIRAKKRQHFSFYDPNYGVDIGYAGEFMGIVSKIMEVGDYPRDWVIGTGQRFSIRSLVEEAAKIADVDPGIMVRSGASCGELIADTSTLNAAGLPVAMNAKRTLQIIMEAIL